LLKQPIVLFAGSVRHLCYTTYGSL